MNRAISPKPAPRSLSASKANTAGASAKTVAAKAPSKKAAPKGKTDTPAVRAKKAAAKPSAKAAPKGNADTPAVRAKKAAAKPSAKTASPKKSKAAPAPAKKPAAKRADYGAPIDAFFAKQPEKFQALLADLRALVEKAAPDAESALKWGMPFFSIDGKMVCGIGAHKAHVNLILSGPPGTFPDPKGLLTGEGETGRRLTLTKHEDLPSAQVSAWIRIAAQRARA